jgi:hypothetical protein
MGCGCKERQEIGAKMISSFRRGDYTSMGQHGREMAQSLGQDAKRVKASFYAPRSAATPPRSPPPWR